MYSYMYNVYDPAFSDAMEVGSICSDFLVAEKV